MGTTRILKWVDMYKDGGSIGVAFKCDDVDSVLFLQIDRDCFGQLGVERESLKFKKAYLLETHKFSWTNKVGAVMDDTLSSKLEVSWDTARAILQELVPHRTDLVSRFPADAVLESTERNGTQS